MIRHEAAALETLAGALDEHFDAAVNMIIATRGRIIVTGIGKSGLVGRKISSTLASTGTPSLFLHPAEASHGDLGMIGEGDLVLMISKSGESAELGDIIEYCRRHAVPIVAITAEVGSTMGRAAHKILRIPEAPEACPMNLVPTTSTTMTLALGDALAICCLQQREFRSTHFRDLHPGGKLGQKLLRVRDLMHTGNALPLVLEQAFLSDAIFEITRGCFGCVGVLDGQGAISGIFTDGDLRRNFPTAVLDRPMVEIMTRSPHLVRPDDFAADVAHLFSSMRIPSVFVAENGKPVGIIHIHDLMRRGLI